MSKKKGKEHHVKVWAPNRFKLSNLPRSRNLIRLLGLWLVHKQKSMPTKAAGGYKKVVVVSGGQVEVWKTKKTFWENFL